MYLYRTRRTHRFCAFYFLLVCCFIFSYFSSFLFLICVLNIKAENRPRVGIAPHPLLRVPQFSCQSPQWGSGCRTALPLPKNPKQHAPAPAPRLRVGCFGARQIMHGSCACCRLGIPRLPLTSGGEEVPPGAQRKQRPGPPYWPAAMRMPSPRPRAP